MTLSSSGIEPSLTDTVLDVSTIVTKEKTSIPVDAVRGVTSVENIEAVRNGTNEQFPGCPVSSISSATNSNSAVTSSSGSGLNNQTSVVQSGSVSEQFSSGTNKEIFNDSSNIRGVIISVIHTDIIPDNQCNCYRALWHCSVASIDIQKQKLKLLKHWDKKDRGLILSTIAETILAGVGDSSHRHIEDGIAAIHFRRPLTLEEEKALPRKGKIITQF